MAKIDRLGWAAGTCIVSYGVRIGVRVNEPKALKCLPDHLPPRWRPSRSSVVERLYSLVVGGRPQGKTRRFNLLYSGAARRARSMDLGEVFEALESDLRLQVAAGARRKVFLHSGVVAWRGRAILIPGRSFAGKTTLVAELLRAGAVYYSDEFAVLDERGRVHPFPKPLAIRDVDGSVRKCDARSFGSSTGATPLPVALVVFSQFREGARWRPVRLSPGQGLLELLASTVPVRRRPEASLAALEQTVSRAAILKGDRGEAAGTARSLMDLLERRIR